MKRWFMSLLAKKDDNLLSEEDEKEMMFSYTREEIIKMSFEQNWDFIRQVEQADSIGYKVFDVSVTFTLKNIPKWYMQKLAAEAKENICGAQDEKLLPE